MELINFENEMTNEEPTFIESKQEPFYFGLPYHRTDWGALYEVYKEMSYKKIPRYSEIYETLENSEILELSYKKIRLCSPFAKKW